MDLKQLMEQRANVWEQMKAHYDEASARDGGPSAEDEQKYSRMESEVAELTRKIDLAQRHGSHVATLDAPVTVPVFNAEETDGAAQRAAYRKAYEGYTRFGFGSLTPEAQGIIRAGGVELSAELRALGVSTDAAGGYTVPDEFDARIREVLTSFSPLRPYVEVITTSKGEDINWPTATDVEIGAILAENTAMTEGDVTFGTAKIGAYTYTSKLVRVSLQLLQDTHVDIEGYLARRFGIRIGRAENVHFMTGNGTTQPQGLVPNVQVGKTGPTGQLTTVTFDDLIDLMYSVDGAYRANGRFLVHDLSVAMLRKLKYTGSGEYIWVPAVRAGEDDTVLGKPITTVNDMPQPGANARSVIFGDLREAYVIRDAGGTQSMRLTERFAEFLQVGFFAFRRTDGKVQNAAAAKAFVHAAT